MHRFLFFFLLFPFLLGASSDLILSDNEDLSLSHHVNVISGHLNLSFQDTIIEGAVTLPILRTYNSSGAFERSSKPPDGYLLYLLHHFVMREGWSWMAHTTLIAQGSKPEKTEILLPEKNGGMITYVYAGRQEEDLIYKPDLKGGQYSGVLSARNNPQNNILRVHRKFKNATLQLPDGSVRIYQDFPKGSLNSSIHLLKLHTEISASKQVTEYAYNKEGELISVSAKNPTKTKIFSSLNLERVRAKKSEPPFYYQVHTSDQKTLLYRFAEYKDRNYLNSVESNCRPHESTHFVPARKGIGARMDTLTFADHLQFVAHYYEPSNRKKEKEVMRHPEERSFFLDKVRCLESPIGLHGEMLPIAQFSYYPTFTDVRDFDRVLTRYHHADNRLQAIEYFDENDKRNSTVRFEWIGSRLRGKLLFNHAEEALVWRTFEYDEQGNVIEEALHGNLTGLNLITSFGRGVPSETYRKWYAYLPGFNIPILEKEEEGPTYRYTYIPNTDLLSQKFVCDQNDTIQIRYFFFYDADHLLAIEITDDGISPHLNDLTRVTQRSFKRYERDPTTGLPIALTESYWNFETGQEQLLKRIVYTYSPQKKVISEAIYDAHDTYRYTLYTDYDSQGHVIRKTTPLGQENRFVYNAQGLLIESKEVGSPQKIYTYNPSGTPLSCNEGGRVSYTLYDPKGRLISQTDPRGNTTTQRYDSFGKCIETQFPKIQNAKGEVYHPLARFTYDDTGNLASTTTGEATVTRTLYNTLRKPILITHPDETQTRHIYNKTGNLVTTIHPDGTQEQFIYDFLQRMISKTILSAENECLSEEKWEYNSFHLISHTDERGLLTTYTYDGAGRLIEERADGRFKAYAYDPLGFLQTTSDGNLIHHEIHDDAGRTVTTWTEDLIGKRENVMSFVYDQENRKISATRLTSQGEAVDYFTYDSIGRLCKHVDPLGAVTQFLYDETERNEWDQKVLKKTTIDPCCNATIETYDPLNHLVQIEKKNPEGNCVSKERFFYDSSGHRTCQIVTVYHAEKPLKEIITHWEYDLAGRLIKETESNQKTTIYTYDSRGKIHTKTLPSGITFYYHYDGLGRLITQTTSDGTIDYRYFYLQAREPVQIDDQLTQTSLKRFYNSFGELIKEINPVGLTYEWEYDNYGRCTQFTLPDHSMVAYLHSGLHLSAVCRYSPNQDLLYTHHYLSFDPNGKVDQEETIFSLGTLQTTHDLLERPSQQISPWFQQMINYGPSGLVSTTQNSLFGSKHYTYDPLNQLIQEEEQAYSFDSIGNSSNCTINDCNELLATADSTFLYDPDGNPIQKRENNTSTSYCYDALGRLIEIQTDDKKVCFHYDPLSRLLSKELFSVHDTHPQKLFYLYDNIYEIGSLSEDHQLIDLKVLGIGIKGDIGAAIAIESKGAIFAPLHDFNGHLIALIDTAGQIAKSYQIDAFGKEKGDPDPITPWRFCSKRSEEGLIFFGKRFYDPSIGRWLTPDPAGFTESPNLYLFVLNSPLNRLDLFGLSSEFNDPFSTLSNVKIYAPIQQFSRIDNLKGVFACKGWIGEVEIDLFIACGHWHKIQFTAEELKSGMVNIVDHFHEILPKEGMMVGLITGQNGIDTKLNEFSRMSSNIFDAISESPLYIGVYNPTSGIVKDLLRVGNERKGIDTPVVIQTRQFMEAIVNQIHEINPSLLWMHISHSEGGLIATQAIEKMTPETQALLQEHLLSFSYGPARPIPNHFGKNVLNVYSDKDYITGRFGKPYMNDPNYTIKFVNCITPLSKRNFYIADHTFMGDTYQEALTGHIRSLRNIYKFYETTNR